MMTLTIPEPLAVLLTQRADRMHVSVDSLMLHLLSDALSAEALPWLANRQDVDHQLSLEELIAQIKATPRNVNAIENGARFGDMEYVDYLLANPPQDTVTAEEIEQYWPWVETELRRLDPYPVLSLETSEGVHG